MFSFFLLGFGREVLGPERHGLNTIGHLGVPCSYCDILKEILKLFCERYSTDAPGA
jgi:hypothetical protein